MKKNIFLIGAESNEPLAESSLFSNFQITSEALFKTLIISRLVKELVKSSSEIGGLLLNFLDCNDGITRDVAICFNQEVSSASASYADILTSVHDDVPDGWKAEGLWHSHGSNLVGHSPHDNATLDDFFKLMRVHNLENILDISRVKKTQKIKLKSLKEGIELRICSRNPVVLNLFLPEKPKNEVFQYLKQIETAQQIVPYSVFFAKSLVVNESGFGFNQKNLNRLVTGVNYYAEIAYQAFPNSFEKKISKNLPFRIIDEKNGICIDERELKHKISECLGKEKIKNPAIDTAQKSVYRDILRLYGGTQ